MDNLILETSAKTPAVNFNATTGVLYMAGKSIPEDTFTFYQVLVDWLKQYLENPKPTTTFDFRLEYFNTSSSKRILYLLKMLQTADDTRKTRGKIKWKVDKDDGDMKDAGEELKHMVTMPFEIYN